MVIHGIQKLTLVDFPSHPAAILFTGGCNFRCPFCQNGSLVLSPSSEPVVSEDEIFSYLRKRRRMLEGVVITGGEPTLQKDLIPFMGRIRELGYLVKLDTNGYRPKVLRKAVESGMVDYVAMDIKSGLSGYARLSGITGLDTSFIEESIAFLMEGRVDFEFRTTVVGGLHSDRDFEEIGSMIEGAPRYYLQRYSSSGDIIDPSCFPPDDEELERFLSIARKHVPSAAFHDR